MPPRKRGREKGQLSMLQFAKPKQKDEAAPSSRPSSEQQEKPPVRPMPRPSSTAFFRAAPKRRRVRSLGSPAEDAWEMGERVLNGEKLTPHVKYGDEGVMRCDSDDDDVPKQVRTPVQRHRNEDDWIDMDNSIAEVTPQPTAGTVLNGGVFDDGNSDDDFEPDSVRRRVAKERPSANRKHSASALRDDRASMTKRSASKRRRAKERIKVSTPVGACSFGVEWSPHAIQTHRGDGMDKRDEDNGEVCDVILLDGEKSEMSATDEDEETPCSPPDSEVRKERKLSVPTSVVTPCRKSKHAEEEKAGTLEHTLKERNQSLDADIPRKEKGSWRNHDRPRLVKMANARRNASSDRVSKEKRPYQLRRLFNSESEDSGEDDTNHVTRKSRSQRTLHVSDSSSDEECDDARPNNGRQQGEAMKGSSTKIDGARRGKRETKSFRIFPSSDESDADGPPPNRTDPVTPKQSQSRNEPESSKESRPSSDREELPKRATPAPFVPFGSRVKRISLTPESSPSPPSTKKRRRLRRLKPYYSDEGNVILDSPRAPGIRNSASCNLSAGVRSNMSKALHRDCDEWYQERDIDDFSGSSQDIRPASSSDTKRCTPVERKRRQLRVHGPDPQNVRRKIFTDFPTDKKENGAGTLSSTRRRPPRKFKPNVVSNAPAPKLPTTADNQDYDATFRDEEPLIDLVGVDDGLNEYVDANDDSVIFVPDDENDSPNNADEIRNSSSVPGSKDEDPSAFEVTDDEKPPPFNLIVLCNEGESIPAMKDRLGEDYVIGKITEAQQAGRDIIGGEEIGITGSFNRAVFSRFSKQVVGDQLHQKQKAKFVTEQALRGEYKFNYRGRDQPPRYRRGGRQQANSNSQRGGRGRGTGRLSNLRRRLRQ